MRKSAVKAFRFMVERKGKEVTPTELNAHLGVGDYSSRTIWLLKNKLGCSIETKKDGRNVVAYILTDSPKTVPEAVVATEAKIASKSVKKTAKKGKAPVKKKTVAKKATKKQVATVEKEVETDNVSSVESSFAVDPSFDELDSEELRNLSA